MVLGFLKDILYSVFVETGFLSRIVMPLYFMRFMIRLKLSPPNYVIKDENGGKINALKVEGQIYPPYYPNLLSTVKRVKLRASDVMICGYPKTGCHWTYEIMYMIVNNKPELSKMGKGAGMLDPMSELVIKCMPSPRILNSHLLYDQLPEDIKTSKTKIVLTERNANDTVVSYYNHHKNLSMVYGEYKGSFHDFFKLFMNGEVGYGCYFDFTLDWHSAISANPEKDIFVLRYEELKENPAAVIKKLARFLEISISDDLVDKIVDVTSFDKMKKARSNNPHGERMFRKGQVGDWKNWMTDVEVQEIDHRWEDVQKKCQEMKKID